MCKSHTARQTATLIRSEVTKGSVKFLIFKYRNAGVCTWTALRLAEAVVPISQVRRTAKMKILGVDPAVWSIAASPATSET